MKAHGVSALINFCDRASRKTLEPYLNPIFQRMSELLGNPY